MLIYCAHAILERDSEEPDWIQKLASNSVVVSEQWSLYRPAYRFYENLATPHMTTALTRAARLTEAQVDAFKIDRVVLAPLSDVKHRFVVADRGPFVDVHVKRLYALLRADIMLVDLNVPSHGCLGHEMLYAYLSGIPIVGIAHRFILSPSVLDKLEVVLVPKTSDQIVRQVLAFDRGVSDTIARHRELETLRQAASKQGSEPHGEVESTG